ncbi:MAG: hypothetical protein KF895_03015 [Parvibaculum sp.]|nr:hypothetical protein [Parvibaculum sp.]
MLNFRIVTPMGTFDARTDDPDMKDVGEVMVMLHGNGFVVIEVNLGTWTEAAWDKKGILAVIDGHQRAAPQGIVMPQRGPIGIV